MRTRQLRFWVVGLFALALAGPSAPVVLADNAPVNETPEGLAPGALNTTVQMADEQVDVQVVEEGSAAIAVVDATFNMVNNGPTAQILTGFPNSEYPTGDDNGLPCCGHTFSPANITEFRAWTDSASFTPSQQPVTSGQFKGELWFVWNMAYPQGKTLPVHVSYRQKLGEQTVYGAYGQDVNEFVNVIYVLRTGALWSGPIGHARITFEAPNGGAFTGADGAASVTDDHIVWDFTNFKPATDVGTAYIFATPWKELQAARAAATQPGAGPLDFLRGAQDLIQLFQTSRQATFVPRSLRDRFGSELQQWVANASVLDSADSWKAQGDVALFFSGTVGHNGFLSCRPDGAIAAYQQAVDLGSDVAAQALADMDDPRQPLDGMTPCAT